MAAPRKPTAGKAAAPAANVVHLRPEVALDFQLPPDTPVGHLVERMAGRGLQPRDIALILGIPEITIRSVHGDAMALGRAKANFQVSTRAFEVATDKAHPKFATMNIFWQRAHMGVQAEAPAEDAEAIAAQKGQTIAPVRLEDAEVATRFDALMDALNPPRGRAKAG